MFVYTYTNIHIIIYFYTALTTPDTAPGVSLMKSHLGQLLRGNCTIIGPTPFLLDEKTGTKR